MSANDPEPAGADAPTEVRPVHAEPPTSGGRFISVDAIRGIAVLGMMFADVIPWDGLPRWMYHGQEPPPTHDFNPNLAALTWVDLVFPFFLFSMGAAIPLALKARMDRGETIAQAVLGSGWRFVLLVAFAVLNQHLRPYSLTPDPHTREWLIGIAGFLLVIPTYARLPRSWPTWVVASIRIAGWLGIAFMLSRLRYPEPDMPGFSLLRTDPIILVLAAMSLFGTLVWLATRTRPLARLWVMAAILAWRVSAVQIGSWAQISWDYGGPAAWFFEPSFLGYLLVILPGTLVGDLLLSPKRSDTGSTAEPSRHGIKLFAATLCVLTIPACLSVFLDRGESYALLPLAALIAWVATRSANPVVRSLMTWGAAMLALGLVLEPFQGGIKKDHPTLSYVIVTPGLAMLLVAALVMLEEYRPKFLGLQFVSKVGQNPLLAYQALTNLFLPVWALTIGDWVADHTPGTGLGLVKAVVETVLFGAMVNGFTRLKLVFRT